jgi:hypothetical protein
MQIRIEIDVRPDELRRFLGLPDVSGLQEDLIQFLRAKLGQASENFDIGSLIRGNLKPFSRAAALLRMVGSLGRGHGWDEAAAEEAAAAAQGAATEGPTAGRDADAPVASATGRRGTARRHAHSRRGGGSAQAGKRGGKRARKGGSGAVQEATARSSAGGRGRGGRARPARDGGAPAPVQARGRTRRAQKKQETSPSPAPAASSTVEPSTD